MRTRIVMPVLVAMIASRVAAQVDKEKLRKLAKLPTVSFESHINFISPNYLTEAEEKPKSEEIAALQKEMKGDASDAERYQRLGELYLRLEDSVRAQEAFAKAADLYRQLVKLKPNDGRLLTQFGYVLWSARKDEEAETVLRQAVKTAPQDRVCWEGLGLVLSGKATLLLIGKNEGVKFSFIPFAEEFGKRLAQSLKNKPSSEQIAQAQKLLDEASDCYDKAVAAAPRDAQAYMARGMFRGGMRGIVQSIIKSLHGEKVHSSAALYLPDAVADFREAARLNPDDWRTLIVAVASEIMSSVLRNQKDFTQGEREKVLSEQSKQFLREATDKLEKLIQSKNTRDAAIAIVTLCHERLKHKDTARNRIVLAKAYERLNQLDKAEEQVQAALKLEPNDFTANLGLAVLMLKRADDNATLVRAGELLVKCSGLIGQSPTPDQWIDHVLTIGIYYALINEIDEAEKCFKQVLDYDKGNEDAQEALKAIGKGSES